MICRKIALAAFKSRTSSGLGEVDAVFSDVEAVGAFGWEVRKVVLGLATLPPACRLSIVCLL